MRKRDPLEKVGNLVQQGGKTRIVEYSDLPEPAARLTNPDGSLAIWAGNTAMHVFSVDLLRRAALEGGGLPFHQAHKKTPYYDRSTGELVEPQAPNSIKFERFIFDLLPHAKGAIVIEADEEHVFAPLKNAPGAKRDTPEFVHERMIKQHRLWLQEAGVKVADGVPVEISPLFALDAEETRKKIDSSVEMDSPTYLR